MFRRISYQVCIYRPHRLARGLIVISPYRFCMWVVSVLSRIVWLLVLILVHNQLTTMIDIILKHVEFEVHYLFLEFVTLIGVFAN